MWNETRGFDPWVRHWEAFEKVAHAELLPQMLYVDTKTFLPSLNLNYNDKMSMACSVEVRVPFLDQELYEFAAWQVPPQEKVRVGVRPDQGPARSAVRRSSRGPAAAESGFAAPGRLLAAG